jgi:hypothetical protein
LISLSGHKSGFFYDAYRALGVLPKEVTLFVRVIASPTVHIEKLDILPKEDTFT